MKILQYIQPILETIGTHTVTQISAPTGTGKSTLIPYSLGMANSRVFLTVPTVSGTLALHKYMSTYFSDNFAIGYAAEGNIKYTKNDRVVYATSGHLRKKMFSYFRDGKPRKSGLDFTDVLIIDEAHTGSIDNTIIISLWMFAFKMGVKVPRLVLLSATPTKMKIIPEPFPFVIKGDNPFQVTLQYIDPKIYSLDRCIKKILFKAIDTAIDTTENDGDVLLFVAGASQVEFMIENIRKKVDLNKVLVVGAYSSMQRADLDVIYMSPEQLQGKRRIIVSTNIAESSITIDGIGVVIDTCIANIPGTSDTGGLRLLTKHITKDSAIQRMGRTGRTRAGKCFRIVKESDYEKFDDHITPEIKRLPIHDIVIELLGANLDPTQIILDIPSYKVSSSIEVLKSVGMVGDMNSVTDMGNFAANVPLGVYNAAFLYKWMIDYPHAYFPGIVVAVILDVYGPDYFYFPRKEQDELKYDFEARMIKHSDNHVKPYMGVDPIHTYINLYNSLVEMFVSNGANFIKIINIGSFDRKAGDIYKEWMDITSTNGKQIKELFRIIKQTYKAVSRFFWKTLPDHPQNPRNLRDKMENKNLPQALQIGSFNGDVVHANAIPIIIDTYKSRILTRVGPSKYISADRAITYNFDRRKPVSGMELGELPEYLVAISTAQIGKTNIISLSVPVNVVLKDEDKGKEEDVSNLDLAGLLG